MAVNKTTFQAITNAAGMLFVLVATTANFPACHKANLHIDSAAQVLAVAKNDEIYKYIHVVACVFTVVFLEVNAMFHLVSEQDSITRTLIRNHRFRPRSPPAAKIIGNGNHYFGSD